MRVHRSSALALVLSGTLVLAAGLGAAAGPEKQKATPSADVAAGKKVYDANGCAACHAVAGKGGKTGPDLTKVGRKLKPAQLMKVVRNPKALKANSLMPAYGEEKIDAKKLKALTAYLSSLK